MNQKKKFYVTTPIYYGTAVPHLGSLYSTLLADVFARWYKLSGRSVFFLTGTDEHGQKVAQAAEKAGKSPQEFVDQFIPAYKKIWHDYQFDYTKFIRTTDPEHKKAVEYWIKTVQKNGDIYKDIYEGWYCTPCETFVADKSSSFTVPACPQCGRVTHLVSEESYFFRLSKYQHKLLTFYERNPDFIIPHERAHEVIRFVQDGLRDLSISRTTVKWGIPFPDDQKHIVYVWADALTNYISAVGYGDMNKEKEFQFWWPADIQVLGKDIVRFHAVYWPAFLMAANIQPPNQLLVHGWIKIGQQKMSKSLNNVIDPMDLYNKYGADSIRYYLLRHLTITHDGQFDLQDVEQRISSDLANDLGNLLNRMLTLALKNNAQKIAVCTWASESQMLYNASLIMINEVQKHIENRMIHSALAKIWEFINQTNSFFHHHEPWKLAKTDYKKFEEIIAATCHSLYTIATVLWPIMPQKMILLLNALGYKLSFVDNQINAIQKPWDRSFLLTEIKPLFEKYEMSEHNKKPAASIKSENTVTIDDVVKVALRVGTIVLCEPIEKSDKLYKLEVDFGDFGKRQILSGVKKTFTINELLGKQAVFVFNLASRTMLGLESQGMLLVVKNEDGKDTVVTPYNSVKNGSLLQ